MFLLKVNKTKITLFGWDVLTSGAVGAFQVRFDFDDCWDGVTKTAVFSTAHRTVSLILDQSDTCTIPWEVLQEENAYVMVGVYGTIGSTTVIPTILCNLGRVEKGAERGNPSTDPTPSEYQQMIAMIQNVRDVAESVKNDADNGVFNGADGADGTDGADGKDFTVKATVASASELPSTAEAGDAYFVGAEAPRDVYTFDGLTNAWVNQGSLKGENGADGRDGIDGANGKDGVPLGRNLLDNWYFVGGGTPGCFPVNQRGAASYTDVTQTIDRWKLGGSNGSFIVADDCVMFNSFSADGKNMEQLVDFDVPIGSCLTFSALVENGVGTNVILGINDVYCNAETITSNDKQVVSVTVQSTNGHIRGCYFQNFGQRYIKIYAAKLELGDHQTLAHQENGVWVLNEIPSYQQELAKCQRYLYVVRPTAHSDVVGYGGSNITSYAEVLIPTQVPMRETPVLVSANTPLGLRCGGAWRSCLEMTITVLSRNLNGIMLRLSNINPTIPGDHSAELHFNNTTEPLIFSAEL